MYILYVLHICGAEGFGNLDLSHVKSKAHVKEEETFEDEQGRSKLLGDIAEENLVLGQPRSREEKAAHPQKTALLGVPNKKTNTVGQLWGHGGGAILGEAVTSALNACS